MVSDTTFDVRPDLDRFAVCVEFKSMIRGRTLYHCHGSEKGKKIATYSSHAKALEVHRAIMADESPFKSARKRGKRGQVSHK